MSPKEALRRIRANCIQTCGNYFGTTEKGFACANHECKYYVAMEALEQVMDDNKIWNANLRKYKTVEEAAKEFSEFCAAHKHCDECPYREVKSYAMCIFRFIYDESEAADNG